MSGSTTLSSVIIWSGGRRSYAPLARLIDRRPAVVLAYLPWPRAFVSYS